MKGGYQVAFSAAGAAYSYVAPYFSRVNRTTGETEHLDGGFAFGAGSRTVTITKKKKKYPYTEMSHFSQVRGRYGRSRRRTLASRMKNNEEKFIDRWQAVSRYGVGGGFLRLCKSDDGTDTCFPLHIMDLSYNQYNATGATNFAAHNCTLVNNASGDVKWDRLPGQDTTGVTQYPLQWQNERGQPPVHLANSMFHKWTQIKLNLYGTLNRPVKYKVFLFKCDADAVPGFSAGSDAELKLQVESLMRPYLYSNLLGNVGEQKKSWRILKQWNFNIDPLAKSDAADAESTNFNMHFKEVKLFVRHDMNVQYQWYDNPTGPQLLEDVPRTDTFQTSSGQAMCHAYPTARLFLGIMATCGDVYPFAAGHAWYNPAFDDTNYLKSYASYDMVVRRCMLYNNPN